LLRQAAFLAAEEEHAAKTRLKHHWLLLTATVFRYHTKQHRADAHWPKVSSAPNSMLRLGYPAAQNHPNIAIK
jgi:hypothetical protein